MIRFAQAWKRYGRAVALRDFNYELPAGGFGLLRGANGSGKSTALKLAAGIALPDRGRVAVAARRIGYVGHAAQLLPSLSVRANLRYQLRLYGGSDAELAAWAERFGVDRFWERPGAALSRGMAQRAALARAFAVEPDLLLLDEPATGLDGAGEAMLWDAVADAHAAGTTVLVARHRQGGYEPAAQVAVELVERVGR